MHAGYDPNFARLAADAERDCYVDWIDALRAVPGNPWRAGAYSFGRATVVVCGGCPARIVNRCFGLAPADTAQIPQILSCFEEHDSVPSLDLDPFADYGDDDAFFTELSRHGLAQTGFHQVLVAAPSEIVSDAAPPDTDGDVQIERVGPEAEASYAMIHERVFGPGLLVTALLSHPTFRCFLARVDGKPAGLGVLHLRGEIASMANGITLPEYRGRGLQLALLRCRIGLAWELGGRMVVSQSNPRNTSMRNQIRAGLSVLGTKSIWSRITGRADCSV